MLPTDTHDEGAKDGSCDDLRVRMRLLASSSPDRHSLTDSLVRSPAIEMGDMLLEHAEHVLLTEDDDVIEALAPCLTTSAVATRAVGPRAPSRRQTPAKAPLPLR